MGLFNSFKLVAVSLIGVVAVAVFFYIQILRSENKALKANEAQLSAANESYELALDEMATNYANDMDALRKLSVKRQKESVYVDRVKTRIIRDDNATCTNAINDIFRRLHGQSNKQSNASSKD